MNPYSSIRLFTIVSTAALWPVSLQAVTVATPSGTHTADPGTGVPWDNVLKTTGTSGSAVYLGGGWVLTANHVFDDSPSSTSSAVDFMGISYPSDPSHIYELTNPPGGTANPDLRLYRLSYDLGLPTVFLGDAPVGTDVTMIGFGGGVKRWGTNVVEADNINAFVNGRNTLAFFTDYDTATPGEGQGIVGDSGGGTFYEVTTGPPATQGWYLGGVMFAVGSLTPGGQTGTFHADLGFYGPEIETIIAANGSAPLIVPEPSTLALLGSLSFFFLSRRSRPALTTR